MKIISKLLCITLIMLYSCDGYYTGTAVEYQINTMDTVGYKSYDCKTGELINDTVCTGLKQSYIFSSRVGDTLVPKLIIRENDSCNVRILYNKEILIDTVIENGGLVQDTVIVEYIATEY